MNAPANRKAGTGSSVKAETLDRRVKFNDRDKLKMPDKISEKSLIANQKKILANQKKILANQQKFESLLRNQATILNNQDKLDEILANQKAILRNQKRILAR
jgi:hypothetical protein